MELGACFQYTTPPNGRHWFVVAVPLTEQRFLWFPFTTKRERSDLSCTLYPGPDVPAFIEHETVIAYHRAEEVAEFTLNDALARKLCNPAEPVSRDLLIYILEGALKSKRLKNRYKTKVMETLESLRDEENPSNLSSSDGSENPPPQKQ